MYRFIGLWWVVSMQALAAMPADTLPAPVFFAQESPALGDCSLLERISARDSCTEMLLYAYLAEAIQYPQVARENGIEGTVIVEFVVETDGRVSHVRCLRDIGAGCGDEAVRAINQLNDVGGRWRPAMNNAMPVRFVYRVPVRFKIEEPVPYAFYEGDTVYTQFDMPPMLKHGHTIEELAAQHLKYPKGVPPCRPEMFQANVLVHTDGRLDIVEMYTLCAGGMAFDFAAVSFINGLTGMFEPARYNDRPVNALTTLRFTMPLDASCATQTATIQTAERLYAQAQDLSDSQPASALKTIAEAVSLWPENAEYLYFSGMLKMQLNQFKGACEDLVAVKRQLKSVWFDDVLKMVCDKAATE